MLGFRNAIKRYLKTERSRLKTQFLLGGEDDCPYKPEKWDRLVEYWGTAKQVKKAATMAHARRQVKNFSSVGRRGKAGKESQMVTDEVFTALTSLTMSIFHFCFPSVLLCSPGMCDAINFEFHVSYRRKDARLVLESRR